MILQRILSSFSGLRFKTHFLSSTLALAALILLITWPSLRYGPATGADALNHFYRLVALDWHVRHGDFYPRWFADVHYGFGGPILNFYAPLSYYLPVMIHFFGVSLPAAYQAGVWLGVAAAVLGMYHWGREQFNSPLAGVTAAVAAQMSPAAYSNLLGRGGYTEVWALAIVPWLFYVALRWMRRPFRGAPAWFTLLSAALYLTHSASTLMFVPLLGLYCIGLWLGRSGEGWGPLLHAGVRLGHAAAIAAFFLVPFFFEAPSVQLERSTLAEVFQFQHNLLEWHTIFSPPVHFDPNHVVNFQPSSLAWPPLALALTAMAMALFTWKRHPCPGLVILMAAALMVVIVLMNWIALPIWQTLPLIGRLQHPARLMNPATVLVAWLAAAGLPQGKWHVPTASVLVAATFLFTLPWTYHDPAQPLPTHPTPADIIRHEIAGGSTALGTTFTQEFLPRWVQEIPASDAMLPRFSQSSLPSRLAAVPSGLSLFEEHQQVNATRFTYEAPQASTLTFNIFYFPGWTAAIDGRKTPIRVSSPQGLIQVDVPAGRHDVQLALRPTPAQQAGTWISALAVLALLIPFRSRLSVAAAAQPGPTQALQLRPAQAWLLAGLLLLRVSVLHWIETPFYYTELDSIPHPLDVHFSDQLVLIGYDAPHGPTFTSGAALDLKLYWRAAQPLSADYQTTVQLVDRYGNRFGQSDHQHPAQIPTSAWKTDQYAIDRHALRSLAGTPPGDYHLRVGVYGLTGSGTRSLEVVAGGTPAGLEYDLGAVSVARAAARPPGPLRLVESSLAVETAGVGDRLPFTIAFVSGDEVAAGMTAEVQLVDAGGRMLFSTALPPAGPDYASDRWTPNELIRYPHAVDLPPDLPAGPAQVRLVFRYADRSPASAVFDLGAVTVTLPERSYVVPSMTHRADHDAGAAIRLLGYDLAPGSITLYWQALQPVSKRYTVFIHRFDPAGAFTGGNDAPPSRPTTSWLPGEVITDTHPFSPGERFQIGLYDPVTGERPGEPFVVSASP